MPKKICGTPGETSYESDINDMTESFADAFESGANFAIGKQEKEVEETVISGWVARDNDGHLFTYCTKPERNENLQAWIGRYADFDMRDSLFPDLTWESEPGQVEIQIKRKKK